MSQMAPTSVLNFVQNNIQILREKQLWLPEPRKALVTPCMSSVQPDTPHRAPGHHWPQRNFGQLAIVLVG